MPTTGSGCIENGKQVENREKLLEVGVLVPIPDSPVYLHLGRHAGIMGCQCGSDMSVSAAVRRRET